ncbi:heavy metal-associated isoprenylated plant protein 41 [Lathyrus oleraceus]|uniref:25S rRNA (uridine-N(3))-methyltransferase BMT5-like domain-containing protein n=1 Tax=Pisum sativum TaxID=3888 RepID=A0A9D4WW87_PEA|nr:heavy metal-associated isoprenylated plant protein 41-like [Pisum sativum]XP_050881138.1 heavy metal-associated isoprenylated plant protein 41-like [Pisum sativum]XP_050881140.1 heavy metal-associated isoprenylated plant protein 41-like [Pisum sativum]KAI5408918.1 hypothetical protein KIW84_054665 [Pisum sativum]
MMIKMHVDLVFGFFKNASYMFRINGEVHVNHKTTPPFDTWNIEKLAEQSFLMMIECADFKQEAYPGYNNKRGHRSRCDDPFPLGKCSTFKFIYNPRSLKDHLRRNHVEVSRQQEIQNMERFPASVHLNYHPQTTWSEFQLQLIATIILKQFFFKNRINLITTHRQVSFQKQMSRSLLSEKSLSKKE